MPASGGEPAVGDDADVSDAAPDVAPDSTPDAGAAVLWRSKRSSGDPGRQLCSGDADRPSSA